MKIGKNLEKYFSTKLLPFAFLKSTQSGRNFLEKPENEKDQEFYNLYKRLGVMEVCLWTFFIGKKIGYKKVCALLMDYFKGENCQMTAVSSDESIFYLPEHETEEVIVEDDKEFKTSSGEVITGKELKKRLKKPGKTFLLYPAGTDEKHILFVLLKRIKRTKRGFPDQYRIELLISKRLPILN